MRQMRRRFLGDDSGATAIEYGLIAALITLVVLVGVSATGGAVGNLFGTVSSRATAVWQNAGASP